MNEKLNETLKGIYDSLTEEQKEKANACKTMEELLAFAKEENIELSDELLEAVSGGVQAGLITTGGSGEFGPHHPDSEEQKPHHPTWF